jgi:hypothetical protein
MLSAGFSGRRLSQFAILIVCFQFLVALATAVEPAFIDLRIEKKPGATTGSARILVNGKSKILARNAVEAWPVMDGANALVVVVAKNKKGESEFHVRFYEGRSRKYRDLGTMPYEATQLIQGKQSDGKWVFALTGTYLGKPTISLTGMNGINGVLRDASEPKLHDDSLTFLDANGNPKTLPIAPLVAGDMTAIYEAPAPDSSQIKYVQFLRTGTVILTTPDGQYHNAVWRTNGEDMIVTDTDGHELRWPRESLKAVTGVPAGTRLAVRLIQPIASEKIKNGDAVEAVLISPATIDNKTLMPQGTLFSGKIVKAHGVGWGVAHETAAITLNFSSAKLPDGEVLTIHTQLDQVENSREDVNDGKIQGIRSTGTIGYSAEGKIASVASIDPIAYLFTNVAATATLGFADPEIRYAAGTEMLVQFIAPVITTQTFPRAVPEFPHSVEEKASLLEMVKGLPFRTATQGSNKVSDITNLIFIGPPEGLRRAFAAAGWVNVQQLTAGSTFMTMKTLGGNQVFNEAPMSTLLLADKAPIITLTKTTNTFNARHHLRVFEPDVTYQGEEVLTSSSTQDIRVAFSYKQKTFIHVIDEYIDNERSKVVNDLEFTGCVEEMDMVPRPWVPLDAYNSTGDRLITDGAVAVMKISDCKTPHTTPSDPAAEPSRFKRGTRNTVLAVRNDIYRGNLIYTGVSGIRWTAKYFKTKDELQPVSGAWRTTDQSGTLFKGEGRTPLDQQSSENIVPRREARDEVVEEQGKQLEALHRWDPPRYEIALQGGYMRYPNIRSEAVILGVVSDTDPNDSFLAVAADGFDGGWTAGISVTLNSWKWFSNQFSYTYQRGKYNYLSAITGSIDGTPLDTEEEGHSGLITRQFEYNLLFNLRPPKSRWHPYAAVGPALLLTSLSDSPIKKAAGPFKLGLQNVGLLLAAYDFGSTPPLSGGGVFAPGLVYGGGFKYRVHPRITLSTDFRETLSRGPQFITNSYTDNFFVDDGFQLLKVSVTTDTKYRQQRFTTGVAFTF